MPRRVAVSARPHGSALRRLSSNPVDVLTPQGEYLRALGGLCKLVTVRVIQPRPAILAITLVGDKRTTRTRSRLCGGCWEWIAISRISTAPPHTSRG